MKRVMEEETQANAKREAGARWNAGQENAAQQSTGQTERWSEVQTKMRQDDKASRFLIAQSDLDRQRQKELLYEVLGPVFFGEKRAADARELEQLFRRDYSIDVHEDFYEGDEHYEEYLEAQQAIAEGLSIYGGSITFEDSALAELAEQIWQCMEKRGEGEFRRINTALEE